MNTNKKCKDGVNIGSLARITVLNLCFLIMAFSTQAQSYLPLSGSMDKYTVFDFSQHWNLTIPDTQVFHTTPDINIRGWQKWDHWGTSASNYGTTVTSQYQQRNISFVGGVTTTVYFFDEAKDSVEFKDMVTRDASNNLVPHNIIGQGAYRGNLANPKYRDYVVSIAKLQIDKGVDGIFYDEAISSYDGITYNGNEGFDDYTIRDFNQSLADKYPNYTKADWISKFSMTDSNYLNTTLPLDDLNNNFNYREYLLTHGWQNNPLTGSNPLSKEWGKILDNRADTISNTFLSKYITTYWRDIVTKTRQYAKATYNKDILITSNGLLPYVDFQSFGLYDYNHDNPNGSEVYYVPLSSGHLNGSTSYQNVYQNIFQKSKALSGSAPVVLFLDWPTQIMTNYYNLPLKEKEDYWKIYAAEAYSNGLFMAFHLRTSIPSDPTASDQGVLDFLRDYPKFYKTNSSFYHKNTMISKAISVSASGINTSLMYQGDSSRYTLHLVNHNYVTNVGMTKMTNFTISLSIDSLPGSVYVKSPDFSGYRVLNYNYNGTTLTISIASLEYYDVIVLDYSNTVLGITGPVKTDMNDISIFPNPSNGSITINCPEESIFKGGIAKISDSTGNTVKEFVFNKSQKYDLNLPTGIYYLIIRNGNFVNTKKFILN